MSILCQAVAMPRAADETRKRILEGAYRLFRRSGYSRVTMDDIAAAARLTKRTLYHHFRGKDQLLADVLEDQHHLAFRHSGRSEIGCRVRPRRSSTECFDSWRCGLT